MGIFLALAMSLMVVLSLPAVAHSPHASGGVSSASAAVRYNNAGVDFFSAGRYEEAIGEYGKAIEDNPRYAEAYSNRGAAFDALNSPDRAVKDYSTAIQLDPSLTAAYSNRAAALGDLGRFSEALSDWNVVIKRHPHSSSAYVGRGFCFKNCGDLRAALSDFNEALRFNPRDAKAMTAAKAVKQSLAADISSPSTAHLTPSPRMVPAGEGPRSAADLTGSLQTGAGAASKPVEPATPAAPPATVKTVSPAVPLTPGIATPASSPATASSAPASSQSDTFGNATPLSPSQPPSPVGLCCDAMYQLIGGICLAFGQYQAAANQYNQAILDNPGDAFAHFRCGNVYCLQGDERAALREYQSAVERSPHLRQAYVRREQLKRTIVVPPSSEGADGRRP